MGTLAGGATTYADWSTDDWDFGTLTELPKVLVKETKPNNNPSPATGGNGTLTYNIVGTIPTGLTTVPTDLSGGSSAPIAIGGTPTTAAAETTLTYEVRDADNDIATLALSITIIAAADGSAANPYLVSTTEELRSIALGTLAGGATTYAGWSTDDWNFGNDNEFPKVYVKDSSPPAEVPGQ